VPSDHVRPALFATLLLGSLLALAAPAAAQSVEERYHAAARLYIAGDLAAAEAEAEAALRLAPQHRRLRALLDRIRERAPDGAGAGGPQDEPDADKPQPGEGPTGGDEGPEGPSPDEPPANGDDPGETGAAPDDGREGEMGSEGEAVEGRVGQPGGVARGRGAEGGMSADDVERLLRAVEAEEQRVLRDLQRRRAPRRPAERDW
jgi:hypothetical protein